MGDSVAAGDDDGGVSLRKETAWLLRHGNRR
jgi:hypothetical protein